MLHLPPQVCNKLIIRVERVCIVLQSCKEKIEEELDAVLILIIQGVMMLRMLSTCLHTSFKSVLKLSSHAASLCLHKVWDEKNMKSSKVLKELGYELQALNVDIRLDASYIYLGYSVQNKMVD